VALDDVLYFLPGPGDPAGDLTRPLDALVEREAELSAVAVCRSTLLQFTERPSTRGGVPVLKRATVSPIFLNDLRHLDGGRIAGTARGNLGVGAEVNAAVEESAGGVMMTARAVNRRPSPVSTPVIRVALRSKSRFVTMP